MTVLPGTAARLEAVVADAQRVGRLPSLTVAVVRGGELVWSGSRGAAVSDDRAIAGDADTQYRIGSVTKSLTTVLVLQLVADGTVDLADRVGQHVPDAPLGDATVRDLLSHGAGWPAEPAGSWWERSAGVPWDDLASANAAADRVLPAGQQYHYSNLAFAVLGRLVEGHRGAPWREVLTERLLVPLRMTRTSYLPEAPHADGYGVEDLTGLLVREPHQETGAMAPAGQLWSTASDLVRWLGFLARPATAPEVLPAELVAAMARAQTVDPDDAANGAYGLGLRIARGADRTLVGHSGSMPGFVCGVFVDRTSGVGAVCLGNGGSGLDPEGLPHALVGTLLELEPALGEPWAPTPADLVTDDVRELLGTWYWGQAPSALRVVVVDGALALRLAPPGSRPGRAFAFRREADGGWRGTSGYMTGERLVPVRRDDGSLSHLDVGTFCYTRTPYDETVDHPGRGWR